MDIFIISLVGHLLFLPTCAEAFKKVDILDSLDISVEIQLRFATTDVAARVVNNDGQRQAVGYSLRVPDGAFISNFSMKVGDKLYHGEVAERRVDLTRNGQKSKGTNGSYRLRIRTHAPARTNVTFYVTYQQVLRRIGGRILYDLFPGGVKARHMSIGMVIREPRAITLLETYASWKGKRLTFKRYRPQPNIAYLSCSNCNGQQTEGPHRIRLEYEIETGDDAGDLIIENSYFTHLFSPSGLKPIPKDILFVLDKSGSMTGEKISKLKVAMKRILDDLQSRDRYGIVAFESGVEFMFKMLLGVTNFTTLASKQYVDALKAGGGTNIRDALIRAIEFLNQYNSTHRSQIIIFLTDGALYSRKNSTLKAIKEANVNHIPIFSLAFGSEADYNFVKKLSRENYGASRRIYENDMSDLQISGFYDDVAVTLMKDVTFLYPNDSVDPQSLTTFAFPRYFQGSELRVSGKVKNSSDAVFSATVQGVGTNGTSIVTIEGKNASTVFNETRLNPAGNDDNIDDASQWPYRENANGNVVERMWAFTKVKENLNTIYDGNVGSKEQRKLQRESLNLSLSYNLVTPLTSLSVDTGRNRNMTTRVVVESDDALSADESSYRPQQFGGGGDPHFVFKVPGLLLPICFDVVFPPRTFIRLLEDSTNGLVINVGTLTSSSRDSNGRRKTYVGEMYISYPNFNILITNFKLIVNGKEVNNSATEKYGLPPFVRIHGNSIEIKNPDGIGFVVTRHGKGDHPVPYLNFEVYSTGRIGKYSNGLLGQMFRRETTLMTVDENEAPVTGKLRTVIGQKHIHFIAKLNRRHDFVRQFDFECWQVHQNTIGLFERSPESYRISTLLNQEFLYY